MVVNWGVTRNVKAEVMVWGGCSRVMWGQPIRGQEVVKWKEKVDSVERWKTRKGIEIRERRK